MGGRGQAAQCGEDHRGKSTRRRQQRMRVGRCARPMHETSARTSQGTDLSGSARVRKILFRKIDSYIQRNHLENSRGIKTKSDTIYTRGHVQGRHIEARGIGSRNADQHTVLGNGSVSGLRRKALVAGMGKP